MKVFNSYKAFMYKKYRIYLIWLQALFQTKVLKSIMEIQLTYNVNVCIEEPVKHFGFWLPNSAYQIGQRISNQSKPHRLILP